MENPYYLWQYQSNKAGWMPIGQPEVNKTEVEVKVTGYVGKYKNFRKATEKDINFLNTYNGAK